MSCTAPLDPGGRVADYLRSCYSTQMVMQADGTSYPVDWYWADPGAPFLAKQNGASIQWEKPHYGSGVVGEVVGAPRPWRDGSVPSYVGADAHGAHPVAGLTQWWLSGAPGPGIPGLRWDGSRGFTNADGPGIFPPRPHLAVSYPLSSSIFGPATPVPPTGDQSAWSWPGRSPILAVAWGDAVLFRLQACRPNTNIMYGQHSTDPPVPFRCTAYNAATGVSTWIDPTSALLSPGEVLTLDGP